MTPTNLPLPDSAAIELRDLFAEPQRIGHSLAGETAGRALALARALTGASAAGLRLVGAASAWGDELHLPLPLPGKGDETPEGIALVPLSVPLLPSGKGASRVYGVLGLRPPPESDSLDEVARHVSSLLVADAIARASSADRLTGLATRAAFERAFPSAAARASAEEPLALMLVDVDGLRALNATQGSLCGDQLLRTLGVAATETVGPLGFASRYGSDELALLAPGLELQAALEAAHSLCETVRSFPGLGDPPPTISVGIALAPLHGAQIEELLLRADQALATAKRRGGGQAVAWSKDLRDHPRQDQLAGIITGDQARDHYHVEALLDTIRAVSALSPLRETLGAVVGRCVAMAGAERGLLLLRSDVGEWRAEVAQGRGGASLGSPPSFATSIAEEALAAGRAISRLAQDDQPISPSAEAIGLQAVLCAPLVGSDVPRGVVYVDTSRRAAPYDTATLAFFGALTRELGAALRNAALYDRLLADNAALTAGKADREQELVRIREHLQLLQPSVDPNADDFGLIGSSKAMREVFATLRNLEGTEVPVVVEGESGTGKELVSRALHLRSSRASGPLVAVNCAAIAPGLIESELFGHRRGSFTGAHEDKLGLLEAACGGTVFLDEVGELPLDAQAKLLRALQEREIRRVGEAESRAIDVRVIAATNRDLKAMVEEGAFREDLYYRLAVFRLRLPPLRERAEDIQLIAEHLLSAARESGRRVGHLSPGAVRALVQRRWPGNVRELRNALERAAVLTEGGPILAEHVAGEDMPGGARAVLDAELLLMPLKEAKSRFSAIYAREAISRAGGSVPAAAKLAGVTRQTLYRLIAE